MKRFSRREGWGEVWRKEERERTGAVAKGGGEGSCNDGGRKDEETKDKAIEEGRRDGEVTEGRMEEMCRGG